MDQSAGIAKREGTETTRAGHHNTASGIAQLQGNQRTSVNPIAACILA